MALNYRKLPVVIILCNAYFVYWTLYRNSPPLSAVNVPIWRFDSDGKYYVVDSQWAQNATGVSVADAEEGPLSKEQVEARLVDHVSKTNGKLMEKIEEEIRDKYSDEIKASVEKQIAAEFREEKSSAAFYNAEKSYKVLDDLRAEYLKHNGDRLRNLLLKDYLQNTTDMDLKHRVESLDSMSVDRQRYFHYVIRDVLGRNEPFGLGVDDRGDPLYGMSRNSPPGEVLSEEYLTDKRINLVITDFLDLQDKHEALVKELMEMPRPVKEIYSGDGIVIAARKKDMVGALNVIVQLREEGSELPIEVVLNSEKDYNAQFCIKLLPQFNAKCVIVETEVGREVYELINHKEDAFPLKVLALVVSSFDNTIYLDADNFPIKNVDNLFTSRPYLDTRCILWPDLWHRTISPKYYEIAGLAPGEPIRRSGISNEGSFHEYISKNNKKDIAFHDLAGIPTTRSVESGQMVISKSDHFRGLFLALYYNLNGPRYYYHLLYQGGHGLSDRETFEPAFVVMKEAYYLNEWNAIDTGVWRPKPHEEGMYFDESTLMQSDPTQSAKYLRSWRRWLREKGMDSRLDPNEASNFTKDLRYEFFTNNNKVRQPTAFFLHVHDPKINSLSNELSKKSKYDYESRYIKNIGEHEFAMGTRDWELRFQAINAWTTCKAFTDPSYWQSFGVDRKALCEKTQQYVKKLENTSNDIFASELNVTVGITNLS